MKSSAISLKFYFPLLLFNFLVFGLFANEPGQSTTISLRLNEWLMNGENQLSIDVVPIKIEPNVKKNAKCEVAGVVSQQGMPNTEKVFLKKIDVLDLLQKKPKEISIRKESINFKKNFQVDEKLPIWQWVTSPKLVDSKALRKELSAEFTKLHGLYAKRAAQDIQKYRKEQSLELAAAYYKTKEELDKSITEAIDLIKSSGMYLADLKFDRFKIVFAANGHLATFHDSDSDTPIAFLDENDNVAVIKAWFYRSPSGSLVLIR